MTTIVLREPAVGALARYRAALAEFYHAVSVTDGAEHPVRLRAARRLDAAALDLCIHIDAAYNAREGSSS